jgi:uncharacterized protein (TIGR02453 family)
MKYFTTNFLNFLAELSIHNERDWFTANKSRFKKDVEAPFLKFADAMIDRAKAVDPRIAITAKDTVFRIYRDTRFSADKTPYKTHMSALIAPGGRKAMHPGGMYLQMSHEDFRIYGGAYQPDKDALQRIREAIAADLTGFNKLINEKNFKEKFGELHGEENKRIPKEFNEAAEKQPLIYKKSFYFFHAFDPEVILRDDLPDLVMEYYLAGKPVGDFFGKAIVG